MSYWAKEGINARGLVVPRAGASSVPLKVEEAMNRSSFLLPPRPKNAIPVSSIDQFIKMGWMAQIKKNGTCSIITVFKNGEVEAFTRHGEPHRAWSWSPASIDVFKKIAPDIGTCTFVAELLHSKVKGLRDINYIHDVLRFQDKILYGSTYLDRHILLHSIFNAYRVKNGTWGIEQAADRLALLAAAGYIRINPQLWIATEILNKTIKDLLDTNFPNDEDEGLVLKDPESIYSLKHDNGWAVKYRKATKNYSF